MKTREELLAMLREALQSDDTKRAEARVIDELVYADLRHRSDAALEAVIAADKMLTAARQVAVPALDGPGPITGFAAAAHLAAVALMHMRSRLAEAAIEAFSQEVHDATGQ